VRLSARPNCFCDHDRLCGCGSMTTGVEVSPHVLMAQLTSAKADFELVPA
jgi:hypothetical protein